MLALITNEVTDSLGLHYPGALGLITNEVTDSLGAGPPESSAWKWIVAVSGVLGAGALAYHGYARTRSSSRAVPVAIGWGILGAIFPVNLVAGGIAIAQGFGKQAGARP